MYKDMYQAALLAVRKAGTDDPEKVAEANHYIFIKLYGSIAGYAAVYRTQTRGFPVIGLNARLDRQMYRFGGMHELGHFICGHVDVNRAGEQHLCDTGFFSEELDSRTIFREEREANLLAADVCICDEDVTDLIGYHTQTQRDYRQLKETLDKLTRSYEQLQISSRQNEAPALVKTKLQEIRHRIKKTSDSIMELEYDLVSLTGCHSFRDMADRLETSETILRYKLEAMRLRDYKIDRQELERYDKIFQNALS